MVGAHRHTYEPALSGRIGSGSLRTLQWGSIGVTLLAFLALYHVSSRSIDAIHLAADAQAASDAAGYLTTLAPPRGSSSRPDPRFLSVASALKSSSFWTGELQVWLDGVPLLPADSAGTAAPAVPLPGVDGTPRGTVAAWGTVPEQEGGLAGLWAGFFLIMFAPFVGRLAPSRPARIAEIVAMVLVWILATDQLFLVASAERAATDTGLLRARRMLETSALSRRLSEPAIVSMTSGRNVTAVEESSAVRDLIVTRDSLGPNVVATGARGQSWRLIAPTERLAGSEGLLLLLAALVFAGTWITRALGARADYFTASSPTP